MGKNKFKQEIDNENVTEEIMPAPEVTEEVKPEPAPEPAPEPVAEVKEEVKVEVEVKPEPVKVEEKKPVKTKGTATL